MKTINRLQPKTGKKTRSRLVNNQTATPPPPKKKITKEQFNTVTFNAITSKVKVRNESLDGVEYVVVPMVMIVEGVLNGSNGPMLYPGEELSKFPDSWNHKPVCVNHPTDNNGSPISACTAEAISKYKIGMIMNTKYHKLGKLSAEAYIDPIKANKVDKRIMEAIYNEETLELSTGLFTENEETPGEFEGEPYNSIARNHRPDHLAVLPDQIGACSINDGAGFIRNQANKLGLSLSALKAIVGVLGEKGLQTNELSHGKLGMLLSSALKTKFKSLTKKDGTYEYVPVYVEEVFNDFVIYTDASDASYKLYRIKYSVSDTDQVTLDGEPEEVVRVIEYRKTDGSFVGNSNPKTKTDKTTMKKKLVDNLIANGGWSEDDRQHLMSKDEAFLTKLAANYEEDDEAAKKNKKKTSNEEDMKEEASKNKKKTSNEEDEDMEEEAPKNKKPKANAAKTEEEWLADAPESVRQVFAANKRQLAARKEKLTKAILANKANRFTAEQLNGMSVDVLENLGAFAANAAPTDNSEDTVDYSGQGEAEGDEGQTNNNAGPEPLTMPVMNWGKESSK